jgi:antitoxin CcdA
MGEKTTVCAKVPAELKEKLANLGVNVSELIRQQLQAEVDRLERQRLKEQAKEVSIIFKKIPPEEFVESVRATRDSR